jgi:hypothetical protein
MVRLPSSVASLAKFRTDGQNSNNFGACEQSSNTFLQSRRADLDGRCCFRFRERSDCSVCDFLKMERCFDGAGTAMLYH